MAWSVTVLLKFGRLSLQSFLLVLLLVACGCSEPLFHPADRVDQDGDGFYAVDASGTDLSVQEFLAEKGLTPQDLVELKLDCNDGDDDIFPNAAELCDGKDNDCDGNEDPDEVDDDKDGFSECGHSSDAANDGQKDCNDTPGIGASIYPGNIEQCDGVDNNCDDLDFEGVLWPGSEVDEDEDEYLACGGCPDGVLCGDCSDDPIVDTQAAATNPGIDPPECSEYLNSQGLGTNCAAYDGELTDWWPDLDRDLDADNNASHVVSTCGVPPPGYTPSDPNFIKVEVDDADGFPEVHGDCNDTDPVLHSHDVDSDGLSSCDGDFYFGGVVSADNDGAVTPGDDEECNGIDNNANGEVDEGFDLDFDGAPNGADPNCSANFPSNQLDCDDNDETLNQSDLDNDGWTTCGADGVVGGDDEDCNDGNSLLNRNDGDNDGATTCDQPADCDDFSAELNQSDADLDGVTSCDGDCDDTNGAVHPGALTICDSVLDNDCNGVVDPNEADLDNDNDSICGGDCDDQNPLLNANDGDGDGFTSCSGECNDSNSTVYPGAPIACDNVADNDCNGVDDLNEADQDGDGYSLCEGDCTDFDSTLNLDDSDSDGYSTCTGDCNDSNSGLNPGVDVDGDGWDVCGDPVTTNGVPADCDDNDASANWNDVDGDGTSTCSSPNADCDDFDATLNQADQDNDNRTSCGTDGIPNSGDEDCDDNNSSVSPALSGESSTRDGLDNDCNGIADEGQIFSGYVAVVEMMISVDPSFSDGVGEYLELFNPRSVDVDLRGWVVEVENDAVGPAGTLQFTFPSGVDEEPIIVPSGSRMVLARANNAAVYGTDLTNAVGGGAGFVWDAGLFSNFGGEVTFKFQNTTIDTVDWAQSAADAWEQGSAMSLRSNFLNTGAATSNDSTGNWCAEVSALPPGSNFGTPGSPPSCN